MTCYILVGFACNDDHGDFAGKVESISVDIGGEQMEVERTHVGEIKFAQGDDHTIRIHRQTFPYRSVAYWYGNWCWNGYGLTRQDYRRLVRLLAANGWKCTSGTVRWSDAFDRLAAKLSDGGIVND